MSDTHAGLVAMAGRWLLKAQRCPVVITDMTSGAPETPDAIGWRYNGQSILVECKASRSDFLADAKKHFRRTPMHAMGSIRYYLAPAGMLKPDEIPDPWGLLEHHGSRMAIRREAHQCSVTDRRHEVQLMMSAMRRLIVSPGVQGVNCRVYGPNETGKARAEVFAGPEETGDAAP